MDKIYALLKDNIVVNVVLFADDASHELMQTITEANDANLFLSCEEYGETTIGGTFDGTRLWSRQPYPSWIKNEEFHAWQPPIPIPQDDKFYYWDESVLGWVEDI